MNDPDDLQLLILGSFSVADLPAESRSANRVGSVRDIDSLVSQLRSGGSEQDLELLFGPSAATVSSPNHLVKTYAFRGRPGEPPLPQLLQFHFAAIDAFEPRLDRVVRADFRGLFEYPCINAQPVFTYPTEGQR